MIRASFALPVGSSFLEHVFLEFLLAPEQFTPLILDVLQLLSSLILHLTEPFLIFLHKVDFPTTLSRFSFRIVSEFVVIVIVCLSVEIIIFNWAEVSISIVSTMLNNNHLARVLWHTRRLMPAIASEESIIFEPQWRLLTQVRLDMDPTVLSLYQMFRFGRRFLLGTREDWWKHSRPILWSCSQSPGFVSFVIGACKRVSSYALLHDLPVTLLLLAVVRGLRVADLRSLFA